MHNEPTDEKTLVQMEGAGVRTRVGKGGVRKFGEAQWANVAPVDCSLLAYNAHKQVSKDSLPRRGSGSYEIFLSCH